jgi:hypothetical protein
VHQLGAVGAPGWGSQRHTGGACGWLMGYWLNRLPLCSDGLPQGSGGALATLQHLVDMAASVSAVPGAPVGDQEARADGHCDRACRSPAASSFSEQQQLERSVKSVRQWVVQLLRHLLGGSTTSVPPQDMYSREGDGVGGCQSCGRPSDQRSMSPLSVLTRHEETPAALHCLCSRGWLTAASHARSLLLARSSVSAALCALHSS